MKRVTLVTGGARSGKSRHALSLMAPYGKRAFIATAEAMDEEMCERIANHQAERDDSYLTVEAPVRLADAIRGLPGEVEAAIVDCLTVWMGNLMHHLEDDDAAIQRETAELLEALRDPPVDIVLVTNELGMGIVPDNPMSRRFRDLAGWLNQDVAAVADTVTFVVSGMPMNLKEPTS